MASFRQLSSGNWQATVRRQSKTFPKLSEARYWAVRQEAEKVSPSRP